MKKKIDYILEGIGGWATVIFSIVVLLPMILISKFLELIGEIFKISFIKRFSLIIGIGIAFIYLDILDIALEVGADREEKEKIEMLKDKYKNYIEECKMQL